jgi:hypothetical protein
MTIKDDLRSVSLVVRLLKDRIPFTVTYGSGVVYVVDHTPNENKGGTDAKKN